MPMPLWKVRSGARLPHAGQVLGPGTVVALPRRLAEEFPHLVEECDPEGTPLATVLPAWAKALEMIRPHETVDVLRAQREAQLATVADLARQVEEAGAEADRLAARLQHERRSLEALDETLADAVRAAQQVQADRLAADAAGQATDGSE